MELGAFLIKIFLERDDVWFLVIEAEKLVVMGMVVQLVTTLCTQAIQVGIVLVAASSMPEKLDHS